SQGRAQRRLAHTRTGRDDDELPELKPADELVEVVKARWQTGRSPSTVRLGVDSCIHAIDDLGRGNNLTFRRRLANAQNFPLRLVEGLAYWRCWIPRLLDDLFPDLEKFPP